MKRFGRILIMAGILFFGYFVGNISSLELIEDGTHPRMVSYEYLTTCPKCGNGLMEGYYSIVDGHRQENCKSCWYFEMGNENTMKDNQ